MEPISLLPNVCIWASREVHASMGLKLPGERIHLRKKLGKQAECPRFTARRERREEKRKKKKSGEEGKGHEGEEERGEEGRERGEARKWRRRRKERRA